VDRGRGGQSKRKNSQEGRVSSERKWSGFWHRVANRETKSGGVIRGKRSRIKGKSAMHKKGKGGADIRGKWAGEVKFGSLPKGNEKPGCGERCKKYMRGKRAKGKGRGDSWGGAIWTSKGPVVTQGGIWFLRGSIN